MHLYYPECKTKVNIVFQRWWFIFFSGCQ